MREVAHRVTKLSRVDGADHLAEDLSPLAFYLDLGMEACGRCRLRSRAYGDRRESEQSIGLNDHGVAATLLDTSLPTWQRDCVDVTTNH